MQHRFIAANAITFKGKRYEPGRAHLVDDQCTECHTLTAEEAMTEWMTGEIDFDNADHNVLTLREQV